MRGGVSKLSAEDKESALDEPLFTPAPPVSGAAVDAQPPSLRRSVSFAMDDGDQYEGNMMGCLTFCDARTLRELKAVSVAYRRRARQTLGDATSPWRKHPVWSTSARGDELAARVAHATASRRGDALRAMGDDLDRAVELPAYAARVVAKLTDVDRNVRCVAVKTLGRLEPAVLAQHAAAVVAKLRDWDKDVRLAAVRTLGKLEPAMLSQYRASITQWKESERNGIVLRVAADLHIMPNL